MNAPRLYCGNKNPIPQGYDGYDNRYNCLKKGIGVGLNRNNNAGPNNNNNAGPNNNNNQVNVLRRMPWWGWLLIVFMIILLIIILILIILFIFK